MLFQSVLFIYRQNYSSYLNHSFIAIKRMICVSCMVTSKSDIFNCVRATTTYLVNTKMSHSVITNIGHDSKKIAPY